MNVWERLSHSEDGLTERKPEAAGSSDFKETICAFANSVPPGTEAVLFVGISDKGGIIGCKGTDSLQRTIARICADDCYPPIKHRSECRSVDGKDVIAVIIPHSDRRPHFTGHAFHRVGSQNRKSDEPAYSDFILARSSVGAKILEYRGKHVLIRTQGKRIGNPTPLAITYSQRDRFLIEECDSHTVTLVSSSLGQRFFEQTENFSVSRDPETGSECFLIRLPRS